MSQPQSDHQTPKTSEYTDVFSIDADPLDGHPIPPPRRLARHIVAEVACEHGLLPEVLLGRSRNRLHCEIRGLAMRRVREELGYSFPQLGRIFGNRHHTSVIWAMRGGHPGQIDRRKAAADLLQPREAA